VGVHTRRREITEFITTQGSSLIEMHEMSEKHVDKDVINVSSVRHGVRCLRMSQMDADSTSFSVRPDAAATKGIEDNAGMLMGGRFLQRSATINSDQNKQKLHKLKQ